MAKRIEVTITIGDRKVTLEGPEEFVREEIERFAGIFKPAVAIPPVASGVSEERSLGEGLERPPSDAELVARKKPQGHSEIVAVLAYNLRNTGRAEFTADDMRRAYLRARVRPPKVVAQALRDAKNSQDFLEKGSKPGTFRLSDHGERTVVFDLPRSTEGNEK
jgi:hypothetical protein